MQSLQVHSMHSLPGPSIFTLSFFLATSEVSTSRVRRARRRKPGHCILSGEHGSQSLLGAAGVDLPPFAPVSRPKGVGLLLQWRGLGWGLPALGSLCCLAASLGAQREESPQGPPEPELRLPLHSQIPGCQQRRCSSPCRLSWVSLFFVIELYELFVYFGNLSLVDHIICR